MKPTLSQVTVSIVFLAGLLTACKQLPTTIEEASTVSTAAQRAEAANEFVLAAHEYRRLAEKAAPPQRQYFETKAVNALINAGQVREARQLLPKIDLTGMDNNLVARKRILEARIAVQEGEHEQAMAQLNQAAGMRNVDPSLLADIHLVLAQTEAGLDRPLNALRNLIEREKYLVTKPDIANNHQQLWQLLQNLSRNTLASVYQTSQEPMLRGWVELALSVDAAIGPAGTATAIANWKKNHAAHPAGEFVKTLAAPSSPFAGIGRIQRIALLLPLTSEHALAAQAVREGFMAMNTLDARPDKPIIKVYDAGANPAHTPAVYSTAVREGAQLVVGPLGLDAVDQLIKSGLIDVPTLLLSHAGRDFSPAGRAIFQFGLPPEQEAVQAAERAYLDGHRRAVIFAPRTSWGDRVAKAFAAAWERLGGIVIISQLYSADQSDYTEPVKQLLNINASEARKNSLEAILNLKLKFEPRARADIDFIFLAADTKHARLIKPQINYHRATHLPVYSTSHVFTGRGNPGLDADLDGIMFGDMPWVLVGNGKIQRLRESLQRDWPYAHSQLDRLYALGVDAYAIVPWLNHISADYGARFSGVTSGLSLDRDGRLHRQLIWAKFKKGVPQLLDTFFKHKNQFETDDSAQDPFAFSPGT